MSTLVGRMKHRKLRIAWSVGSGIVCALLLATAYITQPSSPVPPPTPTGPDSSHWDFKFTKLITATLPGQPGVDRRKIRMIDLWGFSRQWTSYGLLLAIPHWLPVAVSMMAGYWIPVVPIIAGATAARASRFSLRTLLIATTLVAVGVGLIVWLS